MANLGQIFKPGDLVEDSGVYEVEHDTSHAQKHEVTCVHGKPFPPCRGCKHPRFKLIRSAQHIEQHPHFK